MNPIWLQALVAIALQAFGEIAQFLGTNILIYGLNKSLDRLTSRYLKPKTPPLLRSHDTHNTIPDIHGIELFKALLAEHRFQFHELVALFGTETNLRSVLTEETELTPEHMTKLANYFHISPRVFLAIGSV